MDIHNAIMNIHNSIADTYYCITGDNNYCIFKYIYP